MEQDILINALAVASGGILSFGSILIVIILLGSKGGIQKATAYVSGNCVGYFLIGLAWFALSGFAGPTAETDAASGTSPATWAQLGFGVLLLGLGLRNWLKGKPSAEAAAEAKAKSPLAKIDTMRTRSLFGFGAMISAVNVKNLAIFLSALSIVATTSLGWSAQLAGLAAIIAMLCSSVIAPVVLALIFAKRAMPWLADGRRRIEENMRELSIFVMLLFGSVFAGLAITSMLGLR